MDGNIQTETFKVADGSSQCSLDAALSGVLLALLFFTKNTLQQRCLKGFSNPNASLLFRLLGADISNEKMGRYFMF